MNYLKLAVIGVLAGAVGAILVVRFAPIDLLSNGSVEPHFGATSITTIQGSDTLTASRTTLNNNFASLNANKVEIGDLAATTSLQQLTTLAGLTTTGTITSGTWHGSIVGAQYGGTGSSTLSANELFVGAGTSPVTSVGWGTSGQLLTSNGTNAIPTWQSASFDTTQSYTFTGYDTFTKLFATLSTSTNATTTSSQYFTFLSSTLLKVDSTGKLAAAVAGTDYAPQVYSFASTTGSISTNGGYATSTGFITIPAGVLTASSTIHVHGNFSCQDAASGGKSCDILLRDSTGVTMCQGGMDVQTTVTNNGFFDFDITPLYSASSQACLVASDPVDNFSNGAGNAAGRNTVNTSSVNLANAFTPAIVIHGTASNAVGVIKSYEIDIHP